MAGPMEDPRFPAWEAAHAVVLERLHVASCAPEWQVPLRAWAEALYVSAAARFPDGAGERETRTYLESLNLGDLALATACRLGHAAAWDEFVASQRPGLYAAARALAGDEGRELADGLYAELYGLGDPETGRRSLLAYFHGRSRLATWLRSVLVQRQIDRARVSARLDQFDPLDPTHEARASARASRRADRYPGDFERRHFVSVTQSALESAIDALDARDRLRLRLYYGEDLTLAQIGRLTRESEATVSRKLERARRELRRLVEQALRNEHGLAAMAIAECFEAAADAPELQLTRLLTRAEDG
jgi:RNA polymerase sigma factor (sigma-70 family)